jgi:hypothetical protein
MVGSRRRGLTLVPRALTGQPEAEDAGAQLGPDRDTHRLRHTRSWGPQLPGSKAALRIISTDSADGTPARDALTSRTAAAVRRGLTALGSPCSRSPHRCRRWPCRAG